MGLCVKVGALLCLRHVLEHRGSALLSSHLSTLSARSQRQLQWLTSYILSSCSCSTQLPQKPLTLPSHTSAHTIQTEEWQLAGLLDRFVARSKTTHAVLAEYTALFSGIFTVHPPNWCHYLRDRGCELEKYEPITDPQVWTGFWTVWGAGGPEGGCGSCQGGVATGKWGGQGG